MFCVECGAEGEELIGSVCRRCFEEKSVWVKLPDHVDLVICAHCSSVDLSGKWVDIGSLGEGVEAILRSSLELPSDATLVDMSVKLEETDPRNLQASLDILISSHGMEFRRSVETIVRLKRGSCKECSKRMGSYYEATLQIRGPARLFEAEGESEIEAYVRSRTASMRKGSRDVFISRVDRVKGGLDFYFSTAQAARIIARELQDTRCAEYKESSSIWGRRGGEELSRMTFLVRLPEFRKGDIVEHENRDYLVRSMSKGTVHGMDLRTGDSKPLKMKEATDFVVSRKRSEIGNAVVLMESDTEIQVLDPDTMSPRDLRKPKGFVREGENVRVVKTRLGVYALSDSW